MAGARNGFDFGSQFPEPFRVEERIRAAAPPEPARKQRRIDPGGSEPVQPPLQVRNREKFRVGRDVEARPPVEVLQGGPGVRSEPPGELADLGPGDPAAKLLLAGKRKDRGRGARPGRRSGPPGEAASRANSLPSNRRIRRLGTPPSPRASPGNRRVRRPEVRLLREAETRPRERPSRGPSRSSSAGPPRRHGGEDPGRLLRAEGPLEREPEPARPGRNGRRPDAAVQIPRP